MAFRDGWRKALRHPADRREDDRCARRAIRSAGVPALDRDAAAQWRV